jgi:hypothetical protein
MVIPPNTEAEHKRKRIMGEVNTSFYNSTFVKGVNSSISNWLTGKKEAV